MNDGSEMHLNHSFLNTQKLELLRHLIEENGVTWASLFALSSMAKRGMKYLEGRGSSRRLRGGKTRVAGYVLPTDDARMVRYLYSDIFLGRVYYFEARRPNPLVLDCGSNIGMSILYFKSIFPRARIIGFEPDPLIFSCLKRTVSDNSLSDVRLINAALADREDVLAFHSDGRVRGCLAPYSVDQTKEGRTEYQVSCVRLRDFITEPVDLLKMDIEGAEWDVLSDTEDMLHFVHEIIVEFHYVPSREGTLSQVLGLLERQGFRCYVTGYLQPPVRLAAERGWTQQIYAQRI